MRHQRHLSVVRNGRRMDLRGGLLGAALAAAVRGDGAAAACRKPALLRPSLTRGPSRLVGRDLRAALQAKNVGAMVNHPGPGGRALRSLPPWLLARISDGHVGVGDWTRGRIPARRFGREAAPIRKDHPVFAHFAKYTGTTADTR